MQMYNKLNVTILVLGVFLYGILMFINSTIAFVVLLIVCTYIFIYNIIILPRDRIAISKFYNEHIQSCYFRDLKIERLKIDNYKCKVCNSEVTFDISECVHITYTNLGNESTEDVFTVCKECTSNYFS